jgi:hypothetical protein
MKFLPGSRWFLRSLQFITDKFGDLTLQEPKSCRIIESGIGHLPPALIRVSLVNEAQLRHRLSKLGKTSSDPTGDKVDHTLPVPAATTDPIYQSPLEFDFEGSGEVYMVGSMEELPKKMVKEIQWETDKELTRAPVWIGRPKEERGTMACRMTRVHQKMCLGWRSREETPPKVQFMMHSRPRLTLEPVTIKPCGNQSDRVPGE